ncbi:hypothetical protein Phpb_03153 [Photorhabdus namnaonensis]|uniref:Uncharacterized protein n=1 Tax=Photorhabdus namnaonensis TaxID=1851568 RepID=A0A1B8YFJ3_9GAMM|nr:hypothetical protein Phpb_03153 [Photorhabdus namnaonensis]
MKEKEKNIIKTGPENIILSFILIKENKFSPAKKKPDSAKIKIKITRAQIIGVDPTAVSPATISIMAAQAITL